MKKRIVLSLFLFVFIGMFANAFIIKENLIHASGSEQCRQDKFIRYGDWKKKSFEFGVAGGNNKVAYEHDFQGETVGGWYEEVFERKTYEVTWIVCYDDDGNVISYHETSKEGKSEQGLVSGSGFGTWRIVSGSKASGVIRYEANIIAKLDHRAIPPATMVYGIKAYATSYWVRPGGISVTTSGDTLEDGNAPSFSCTKTYGDGTRRSCTSNLRISTSTSSSNKRFTATYTDPHTNHNGSATARQWFIKRIDMSLTGPSDVDADAARGYLSSKDGTKYTDRNTNYTCQRVFYQPNGKERKKSCSGVGRLTIDEGYKSWKVGDKTRKKTYTYSYTGPVSKKTASKTVTRNFHYVTKVEFRNSTKDTYVTTNAKYNDDVGERTLTEGSYQVNCYKTFASGNERSCFSGGVKNKNTTTYRELSSSEPTGRFTHNRNNNNWKPGDGVRKNYYSYSENGKSASHTVNMLYVVDVKMSDGTPSNKYVRVLETHKDGKSLGTPTKSTDNQITESYKTPKCTKTFAKNSAGHVEKRDCTSQMEHHKNFNNWKMGDTLRKYRTKYKENTHYDEWMINFVYVTKNGVKIDISEDYTYQDEPYPELTCTKTYAHGYGTLDCLNGIFVQNDTGQNNKMNGERKIVYNYVNNNASDPTGFTRVYAHKTSITSNNSTKGYTGHRENYQCEVVWQDSVRDDVTNKEKVWTSTVASTGEEVNYIGEKWRDGYKDVKGITHKPESINQLYIPNPVSNTFHINCDYPHTTYNNGLSGSGYVGDRYAPGHSHHVFRLIGIDNIVAIDMTPTGLHDIDAENPSSPLYAASYTGHGSAPTPNAFNNKTYQSGHFYDIVLKIKYDDGLERVVQSSSEIPELSWRILDKDTNSWVTNQSMYKTSGYNTNIPNTAIDHRLPYRGWNSLRADIFSESGIPMPRNQSNNQLNKTYYPVSMWSHEAMNMVIEGPESVPFDTNHVYKAYLLWDDGQGTNHSGEVIGRNDNPWGNNHNKPTEITHSPYLTWGTSEENSRLITEGFDVLFNKVPGGKYWSKVNAGWGDEDRTVPGFEFWDYFHQELDVWVGPAGTNECSGEVTPTPNCTPDRNAQNPNFNSPISNINSGEKRSVVKELLFNVTGVSRGSGE